MESPFFYSVDPLCAAGRRSRHIESPYFYSADPWSAAGVPRSRHIESPSFYSADPRSAAGVPRSRHIESPSYSADPWSAAGGPRSRHIESPFFYSADPWSAAGGPRSRHIESPFFYSADPWSAAGGPRSRHTESPFFYSADPWSAAGGPRSRHIESPFFYSADPWSAAGGPRSRHIESPFFYSADPWSAAGRRHHPHCPAPVFTANPRVVYIPDHFDGSDEVPAVTKPARAPPSEAVRSSAAVAIQRIFRGHMVRKNVRVVSRIATEVEEIERRVCSEMERLRVDPKERLLVGEMLMALLLRLDSVRGVREYRKKTIRRVIALQEALDSISAQTLESSNPIDSEPPISAEMQPDNREEVEETPREDDSDGANTEEASAQECQDPDSNAAHESASQASQDPEPEAKDEGFVLVTVEESTGTPLSKANSGEKCVDGDVVTDKAALSDSMEQEKREPTTAPAEEAPEISTAGWHMAEDSVQAMAEPRKDSKDASGMGEAAKKVMAESERLQGLVAALFERSAQQCRLMAGLVERVEQLESAVHRMDKKKAKTMRANCPPPSPVDKNGNQTRQ